jgi:ABC-type multidrug transport system fused ATPase/permease subunit
MTNCWSALRKYRKECVLGPLFKLFEALLELLVPLVVAAIIDTGIRTKDFGYIAGMCGILILLGAVGLAFSLTAQYFSARAAVGFSSDLRRAAFAHIMRLSFTRQDTTGASTLITRLTGDINQVQSGLNIFLRLFLRSPFIVFGAMIMAFTIDWKSALVFVVIIPILFAVVFSIILSTAPLYKKVQGKLDGVTGTTRENLAGARVVRAFAMEEREIALFDERNVALQKMQVFTSRISALLNPITYALINIATLVLIWSGAVQVNIGLLEQGQVIALVSYMSQILVELIKLANTTVTVTKAVACLKRVQGVMDLPAEEDAAVPVQEIAGAPAVEFRNVSLMYSGAGDDSLTNISFTARRGETIGVIGSTGSGKSSLVNMIPNFYEATGGTVLVDGVNVKEYPNSQLRAKIGMVPQKAVLFSGTIRSNLLWGKSDATEDEMYDALTAAQALDFVNETARKLDHPVEQNGRNLSGGQRQRLTIARALIRKPEILILDDSSSALDYATDARLRKAIRAMSGDTTLFIVSQRTASLMHADRILVLEDGELAGQGTHTELLENCPVYREIYESQFGDEKEAASHA